MVGARGRHLKSSRRMTKCKQIGEFPLVFPGSAAEFTTPADVQEHSGWTVSATCSLTIKRHSARADRRSNKPSD